MWGRAAVRIGSSALTAGAASMNISLLQLVCMSGLEALIPQAKLTISATIIYFSGP